MSFLLFAVAASAVGIALVLIRNRRPTTMQSSIGDFERGLRALAPVSDPDGAPGGAGDNDVDVESDPGRDPEPADADREGSETEADAGDGRQRDLGAGRTG